MGQVYQATDTKLGRSVALKFLPDAFAHDPERAARFEREAKTLASRNHPNIAALHGLEESDGRGFLVMELVPGQTLDERIHRQSDASGRGARRGAPDRRRPRSGTREGDRAPRSQASQRENHAPWPREVLDFGLAKLVAEDADTPESARSAAVSNSPTMSAPATHAGMILGTAAYMAPEQAKGRPVDQRADIFAFGWSGGTRCCSGRPAFEGENAADILSRVLQRDPRLDADPVERAAVDPSAAALVSRERSTQAPAVHRRCDDSTSNTRSPSRSSRLTQPRATVDPGPVRMGRGRTRGDRSAGEYQPLVTFAKRRHPRCGSRS